MKLFVKILYLLNVLRFSLILAEVTFDVSDPIEEKKAYNLEIKNPLPSLPFASKGYFLEFSLRTVNKIQKSAAVISFGDLFDGDSYLGFSISKFQVMADRFVMKVSFTRQASNLVFRIRYNVETTEEGRVNFFNSNKDKFVRFERLMKLLVKYELLMRVGLSLGSVSTELKKKMGENLVPGKYGQLTCELDGIITENKPTLKFSGTEFLEDAKVVGVDTSVLTLKWFVRVRDHDRIVECHAGAQTSNVSLKVYHYMTEVTSRPAIVHTVKRNSLIECRPGNGYPSGRTRWRVLRGPPNADIFYRMEEADAVMVFNRSVPLGTNWTLSCSGSNEVPAQVKSLLSMDQPKKAIKRMYGFTIVAENSDQQGVKSSTAVILSLLLLVGIVAPITVFCVLYQPQIRTWLSQNLPPGLPGVGIIINSSPIPSNDQRTKPQTDRSEPVTKVHLNDGAAYKYAEVSGNGDDPDRYVNGSGSQPPRPAPMKLSAVPPPVEPRHRNREVDNDDNLENDEEVQEAAEYMQIVATLQPRGTNQVGPVDRV